MAQFSKLLPLLFAFSVGASIAAPQEAPSEAEVRANLTEFAGAYQCQGSGYSLLVAVTDRLPCPAGQNLIPLVYGNLKNGTWDRDDVLSIAKGEYALFQPGDIDNLINIGSSEPDLVVIEYTDPQCPFCISFLQEQFHQIKQRFIDTGKVQYRIHHTPLEFHKDAFLATEAGYCADDQGHFRDYRHLLMRDMNKQGKPYLVEYARQLKLDEQQFLACLEGHTHAERVEKERAVLEKVMPITFPFFVVGRYKEDQFTAQAIYATPYLYRHDAEAIAQFIEKELLSD